MWMGSVCFFFFFNDTATTEIYTLSLHDALPISARPCCFRPWPRPSSRTMPTDRKSTRLNSSHQLISYAVFCLKKKKHHQPPNETNTNKKAHGKPGEAARAA